MHKMFSHDMALIKKVSCLYFRINIMANGWEGWLKDAKLMGYSGQLAHQFCDSLSSILGMYVTFVYV